MGLRLEYGHITIISCRNVNYMEMCIWDEGRMWKGDRSLKLGRKGKSYKRSLTCISHSCPPFHDTHLDHKLSVAARLHRRVRR